MRMPRASHSQRNPTVLSVGTTGSRHHDIKTNDAMMPTVRTTVTLDPDVEQIIRRRMRERGISFKEALNDAVRSAGASRRKPFVTEVASMGESRVNLDRALQIAADLEDDDLLRRMRAGS